MVHTAGEKCCSTPSRRSTTRQHTVTNLTDDLCYGGGAWVSCAGLVHEGDALDDGIVAVGVESGEHVVRRHPCPVQGARQHEAAGLVVQADDQRATVTRAWSR